MNTWLNRFKLWSKVGNFVLEEELIYKVLAALFVGMVITVIVGIIIHAGSNQQITFMITVSSYMGFAFLLNMSVIFFALIAKIPLGTYNMVVRTKKRFNEMKAELKAIIKKENEDVHKDS